MRLALLAFLVLLVVIALASATEKSAAVAAAAVEHDAALPSSSSFELDAKTMGMARRIIQKIKDYSKTDHNAVEVDQQQQQLPVLPSSWQMLLRTLEKSFLGIVVAEEEEDSFHSSSTPQQERARLQALQWLTLDYEKSIHHRDRDKTIISHREYETGLLDRYALATIYFATNGNNWTYHDEKQTSPSSSSSPHHHADSSEDHPPRPQQFFLSPSSHLRWSGVNGNNRDGRVTMLDLSRRNLESASFLPLELALLSPTLELLWLSENTKLSGTIPEYIGADFASLSSLSLYRTSMTGTIPESLYYNTNHGEDEEDDDNDDPSPKLTSLRLYKSKFSGSISSNIGKLSGLRWLWLHENGFSGTLPRELGSLSKLEGMTLHGNRFDVIVHDGLKSNIIPESVCTNLRMTTTTAGNVGGSNGGGELKHLWTDCEEDALRLLLAEDDGGGGESKEWKNASISVKACSCCTRCFPRSRKKNESERISSSIVARDEAKKLSANN